MTKLMEWLVGLSIMAATWLSLVMNESDFSKQYRHIIVPSPIIFVLSFGLYAATVVLYRVFTFNDCEEAAAELQKEITQAKKDLTAKGFVF